MTYQKPSFEEIYQQNQRRIHYQISKLNIIDPHKEYFQEGLCAMWNAYERYEPDKGPMATYFNYMIRNRLIDRLRKDIREQEKLESYIQEEKANYLADELSLPPDESPETPSAFTELLWDKPSLWIQLKSRLTQNQWKWVYYFIIDNMPIKEIAIQENTTQEAVKSWGKQVWKKLRTEEFRQLLKEEMMN
ncbi:sigma-70 family RNA polymerase sigma factor [Virgibacillus xinjiangensis]|uniref:Sigma-70 family RNA polymerase sigma factor n=1 Tax=Virgibacillus xinjiangensis TaxID=393090 RepID=A0ABV7CYI4_9BACI